jgi:hypothetical protein
MPFFGFLTLTKRWLDSLSPRVMARSQSVDAVAAFPKNTAENSQIAFCAKMTALHCKRCRIDDAASVQSFYRKCALAFGAGPRSNRGSR